MILKAIRLLDSWRRRRGTGAIHAPGGAGVYVVEGESTIAGAGPAGLVTREGLGIETVGGVFTPLLPTGTKVPCAVTERFATAADRQTEIAVKLYRGNDKLAHRNQFLGDFRIVGLRPARHGESQVNVTLRISEHKQIVLAAENAQTREPVTIRKVG